ncbi:3-oxoacyl-[acyl-carrier-protein] synthase III C-terminal domain-containing protein [Sciscionella marina]|uniref:3-oxoacyl-[acyl-carrier-protein] synthase III C-terminal domain-containing protein n=1 Tax=Sciscionella marina TaxID=508770 RepID=UPI0003688BEB|nr:3-oxoacyl-[acyl-carrier-protein] synthase III C-terminal domain-containing protein [Sciscionella marina]
MRHDTVHIIGIGAALGDLTAVQELPTHERYRLAGSGYDSIAIANTPDNNTAIELAAEAGHHALAAYTMTNPGPLLVPGLHLHASLTDPARDRRAETSAAAVRAHLGLASGFGDVDLGSTSNTLLAGIDLGTAMLDRTTGDNTIMLTGATCYTPALVDNQPLEPRAAYGDGASAILLGNTPGLARIRATHSRSAPELRTRRSPPPPQSRQNSRSRRERAVHGIRTVLEHVLDDAGITQRDLQWVLTPHYEETWMRRNLFTPLGIPPSLATHACAQRWGHLGPNDPLVVLTHLYARSLVEPGDLILLLGASIASTCSAVLLEITDVPAGMRQHAPPTTAEQPNTTGKEDTHE